MSVDIPSPMKKGHRRSKSDTTAVQAIGSRRQSGSADGAFIGQLLGQDCAQMGAVLFLTYSPSPLGSQAYQMKS